jgi:uracil-DNA glycosylase family 4
MRKNMKKLIQYIPVFKGTSKRFNYAIVAEAPGAVEMQTGIPFTGPEGYYMNKLFKAAGVDRYAVPITNTVHVQPFKNVYDTLPKEEIEFGREQLRKDLIAWKKQGLTTVIALGAKAFEMLTGLSGITKYRGTAVPCSLVEDLKVYSTFHAGYLIRGNGNK